MSHGAIPSASREFEGLELDHEGKQISFPGYKVGLKESVLMGFKF